MSRVTVSILTACLYRPSEKSRRTDLQMPEEQLQRLSKFRSGGSGADPAARSFGGFGGGSRIEAIAQRDLGGEGRLRAKIGASAVFRFAVADRERLAARDVQRRVEGVLGFRGVVAVGLGKVFELAPQPDDGNGALVRQARLRGRWRTRARP